MKNKIAVIMITDFDTMENHYPERTAVIGYVSVERKDAMLKQLKENSKAKEYKGYDYTKVGGGSKTYPIFTAQIIDEL